MENIEEQAVWLKHNGYNCCQAVIKAITDNDETISETERAILNRAAAGFRTGMGGMEATCGALCGAVMLVGLKSEDTVKAGNIAKQIHKRFTELSGASICKILKSRDTNGKILCDCDTCVRHGVRVYYEVMNN